jgi:hypothetical protein
MSVHFTGMILHRLAKLLSAEDPADPNHITIDQAQQNGAFGVHQRRIRLKDDPTVYRLLLAPENAPIWISGLPVDEHFIFPLGASS